MNSNEREILKMLSEDPFLSQNEIADRLGITRSSVSVYISNLIQAGYILGRGYLLNQSPVYYVIGAAIVDYRTVVGADSLLDGSTMFYDNYDFNISYGGVCKNVGETLSRLGNNVSCIFAAGDDVLGKALVEECKNSGVDISDILVVPSGKTSTFLEIRAAGRPQILLSSTDTRLQKRMTPGFFQNIQYKLKRAGYIIVEDGLSEESLHYLATTFSKTVMIGIKPGRTKKYADLLGRLNGLVVSERIAREFLGISQEEENADDDTMLDLCISLRRLVNGPVLLCYGENKACYCNEKRAILGAYSDFSGDASLYTHYRDSVAAGFLHCQIHHIDDEDLLKVVLACREIAANEKTIVGKNLCYELVQESIRQHAFQFSYKLA